MHNRPYGVNYAERPSAPPTRYVNWSAPGGATAVPGAVFTGRQPVHSNLVRPRTVDGAPLLANAPVLAKPGPTTIPHAKPTIAVPPPAERYYRRPADLAPGGPLARPDAQPSWRGPGGTPPATSAPPAASRPATPGLAQPAAPRVQTPPSPRTAAPAYGQGTWGAPVTATPPSGGPPSQPAREARPAVPATRPDVRPPATAVPPPQQGTPMPSRSAPPAAVAPATRAPAQQAPARSAPPAAAQGVPVPPRTPPAGQVPPPAPQPRGMGPPSGGTLAAPPPPPPQAPQGRSAPPAKPVPQRDDKPRPNDR
jgi:hypothetical protein